MPTTVIVNFEAKPGKRGALIELLSGVQPVAIEAGCHSVAVHTVEDSDTRVVEIEHWDSRQAHEAFVGAAVEAGAFAPFDELLGGPFEILYLETAKKTEA
jgi:quinol monooxygenase YgiN